MSDLWYPAAERNDAPVNLWGDYRDDDGQWKYVLHTTESKTFMPNPSSYYGHKNYPHATIGSRIWQHIPINRAARALVNKPGGSETNADLAVQVEIVWKAAEIRALPDDVMDRVRVFGEWAASKTGMSWSCGVTFVGPEGSPSGVNAPQRLKADAWDNYAGICGHQHVPENSHWDPGHLDIMRLLSVPPVPQPEPEPWMRKTHWMMTPDGNGIIVFDGYQGKPLATPDEFYLLVANGWIEPHNPANDQERMQQPIFDFLTRP